jgi:23S rRNA (adenine1618-N6)-methyltransferase
VPNRFKYLLYIHDLLSDTAPITLLTTSANSAANPQPIRGFDIGTGSSAIYPLLGCATFPSWTFLASEADTLSHSFAAKNISANSLENRIQLLKTEFHDDLLAPLHDSHGDGTETYDFTMLNPPFYESAEEMASSTEKKALPPHSFCTGSENEMVTRGGEIAFVSSLIASSSLPENRNRVRWFTSMLGKFSSLEPLIEELGMRGVDNYAVHDLVMGGKTRRWVLAWSWMDWRPGVELSRDMASLEKRLLPPKTETSFVLQQLEVDGDAEEDNKSVEVGRRAVEEALSMPGLMKGGWKAEGGTEHIVCSSSGNVWSRAARRKRKRDEIEEPTETSGNQYLFAVKITVRMTGTGAEQKTVVRVRWSKGHDHVLYESFCGMLKRQIGRISQVEQQAHRT